MDSLERRTTIALGLVAAVVSFAACRKDPSARSSGAATEAGSGKCDGVLRDCDGKSDNGCETRIGTSADCGGCNQRCADGERCVGTSCQPPGGLAMAPQHTCVLDVGGRVRCWGANANGELGDGTRMLRDRPVTMVGIDDAVQVVASERQTCVRRRTGAVVCVGRGIGMARSSDLLAPTEVEPLRGVTDVALHTGVLCGLKPTGAIVCMPSAANPEVGPPPGPPVTDAVDLAAVPHQLCASRRDGSVTCWNMDADVPVVVRQEVVEGVHDAVSLTSGGETICALRSDGKATCFGDGIVTTSGVMRPTMVGGAHDFGEVGAVSDLAFVGWPNVEDCATLLTGQTVCWAPPRIDMKEAPRRLHLKLAPMSLPPAYRIEATSFHAAHCALTKAGDVYCWGDSSYGRLGVGRPPEQPSPRAIEGVTDVREVVASDSRACARNASGAITCWGGGKLPHAVTAQAERLLSARCASMRGELVCFDEPFEKPLPTSGLRDVVQLVPAARGSHVLSYFARHKSGEVSRVDWERSNTSTPTWSRSFVGRVKGLTGVKELLVTDERTCARDGTSKLRCWSSFGTPPKADGPLEVEMQSIAVPAGFEQVRVNRMTESSFEACGVRGGKVACWNQRSADLAWVDLSDVRRFDISSGHMLCAQVASGALSCWGTGFATMTGNGTVEGARDPERVPGLDGIVGWAFAQKSYNTEDAAYVWLRDGRVLAWGHNGGGSDVSATGQLGWIAPPVVAEPTKVVGSP
ncbi:MAG: repeat domain protein [Myxococcaceae bacterium]|nr:repeat domain protein [Myxococcaceae bacterium]